MSQPPPDSGLPPRPHGRLQLRLGALGVAVVVLFMLLVLRLWALQVLNTRTFVAQAASNHEKQVVVRAPRGEILDARAACSCATASPTSSTSTRARCATARSGTSCCCASRRCSTSSRARCGSASTASCAMDPVAPVTLATDIDVQLKWYLQENPSIFRGLSVAQVPLRYYPYRTLGAHIYGQLSEIGPKQLQGPALPRLPPRRRDRPERRRAPLRRVPARRRRRRRRHRGRVRPADRAPCATSRRPCRAATCASRSTSTPSARPSRRSPTGCAAMPRRARRRARSSRSIRQDRRGARAGVVPDVRPELVHLVPQAEVPEPARADHARRRRAGALPAARPRDRGPLPGRLGVQAVRRDRRRQGAARDARQDAAVHAERPLLRQALPQLGRDVRPAHQPRPRRSSAPATPTSTASATTSSARAASRAIRCRTGRPSSASAPRRASTSSARTRACCPTRTGRRTSTRRTTRIQSKPAYDPQLAVRLELERRRRDQPLDRAGQPQRHAAAARGRLCRDRQRRHRRDAARRERGAGARTSRPACSRPVPHGTINIGSTLLTSVRSGLLRATHQPAGTATNVFGQFAIPVAGKTGTAQRLGEPDYAVFASYAPGRRPEARRRRS